MSLSKDIIGFPLSIGIKYFYVKFKYSFIQNLFILPFFAIQNTLQTQEIYQNSNKYNGIIDCFKCNLNKNGFSKFFNGLSYFTMLQITEILIRLFSFTKLAVNIDDFSNSNRFLFLIKNLFDTDNLISTLIILPIDHLCVSKSILIKEQNDDDNSTNNNNNNNSINNNHNSI
eukprot:TRINITY_DN613_c0_g3_i5.p1 TRINITY_DN613_c0_g3~~TRINITY_DN613_c0_g3_i5.p1  ORF type:complete len:172 (+),score=30.60 TRINITY_DN613_c0_g3_i5:100-615(+)